VKFISIAILVLSLACISVAEFSDGSANTSVDRVTSDAIADVTIAYKAADTVVSNAAISADTVISTNVVTLSGGGEVVGDLVFSGGKGVKFRTDAANEIYLFSTASSNLIMRFTRDAVETNTLFNVDLGKD